LRCCSQVAHATGDIAVTTTDDAVNVKTQSPDRTGLMILRLWIEGNVRVGFRARITQTLDSAGPKKSTEMAGSPEDVCVVVQRWVDEFVNSN
jgi:hypothetical protein